MELVLKKINKLLKKNDIVVAAVSGGADSMLLLHLLLKIREKKNIEIICSHINHGVRKASEKEKDFVESFCEKNNITFEYSKLNINTKGNFHHEARKLRYHFLNHVVYKHNAKYLMTAHHGDDLIETILMKISRGSTIKGYLGFNEFTEINGYSIYRPLISMDKKSIYKYCKENNIKYVTDKSNLRDKYKRNRYRRYILPFLKKEDSNVHSKFLKYNETIKEVVEYFDFVIKNKMDSMIEDDTLDLNLFSKEYIAIKKGIIQKMIENKFQENTTEVNQTHLEQILDMIDSKKTNSSINLPNNIVAIKDYGRLLFQNKKEISEFMIEIKDSILLPNNKTISIVKDEDSNSNNVCRLNLSDIKLPLYARNKKEGDKISVKGLNGNKKVSDIFIDEKVSTTERSLWPVVVDSNDNIIWIPGLKKSKIDKPKDKTCDIILKYR
jgi:tRNA(Ile)-lysidine synthase